jgi:transcriptional regulator with XRE-family HTH domain
VSELRDALGAGVRQARKTKGWSQQKLAEAASLSVDMVSRIERGDVGASFETIETIAKVLAVPPQQLFSDRLAEAGRGSRRAKALSEISRQLSRAPDREVERAARLIKALLAD